MLETIPRIGYDTYALALAALWVGLGAAYRMREWAAARRWRRSVGEAGDAEPASLHPVVDAGRCIGCGACTHACPEGGILGLIGGKAQLIEPGACIGHGACKSACPVGAIELVLGSARRGVDIPVLSPAFESSVPGIFVAGELGGMGLIANAVEQGRQAVDSIARRLHDEEPVGGLLDVVIVGAGPAGIAASLAAKERGLAALTLEQDTLGGTVARYPRGKIMMSRPAHLPLYGKVRIRRARKERLITLWRSVIARTGVEIRDRVRVEHIRPRPWGFEVTTSDGIERARTVLLATGRRGAPRRLGVPGEGLDKVVYGLDDPGRYAGRHVLVVGGGDSALEAAVALARQRVASVTLAHRGAGFARARPDNVRRIEAAVRSGRLTVMMSSQVRAIEPAGVVIERGGQRHGVRNDAVVVCAGGVLPAGLLAEAGVAVETHYGAA